MRESERKEFVCLHCASPARFLSCRRTWRAAAKARVLKTPWFRPCFWRGASLGGPGCWVFGAWYLVFGAWCSVQAPGPAQGLCQRLVGEHWL